MNYINLLKKRLVNKYPQLGKWINYKFELTWEDDNRDHVLGGSYDYDSKDLIEDGDWHKPLKEILTEREFYEIQKGSFLETYGCTGYGTLNGIELIVFVKFLQYWNKSDRYTNKASGTHHGGNSIKNVFTSIGKNDGLVDEVDYSWDRNTFNWAKYYESIPTEVKDKGEQWLKEYAFHYEKVGNNHVGIRAGLRKSPVGVGVYAWYKRDGVYYSSGRVNHWTLIIKQNWGKNYIILDSYPPYIKVLDWNFNFEFPRIFFVDRKERLIDQSFINKLIARGYKFIMRADKTNGGAGQIYELTSDGIRELEDQEKMEIGMRALHEKKDLTGISEVDFNNLLYK